jgi:hypothetical protein
MVFQQLLLMLDYLLTKDFVLHSSQQWNQVHQYSLEILDDDFGDFDGFDGFVPFVYLLMFH